MSNWNSKTKLKTNKTLVRDQEQKLKIKKLKY
jgi:hypothetical protein